MNRSDQSRDSKSRYAERTGDRESLLRLRSLKVFYRTYAGFVQAVDGVSLSVKQGERLGLAGESGCGKSTLALAIPRLLPPQGFIADGSILLNGNDLVELSEEQMRQTRWRRISLVPQGAMNSLNPVMRIRDQIGDVIVTHEGNKPRRLLCEQIRELLGGVGLSPQTADMFPHELSGGMKQRVCVAMAIALNPQVIIADEPTSALDVVVQRTVMQTLIDVQERLGTTLLLIGHDMGLMAQTVHRLAIMYAGQIVEVGTVRQILRFPRHPYSQALVASLPSLEGKRQLTTIPGLPPALFNPPPGCRFEPRCASAVDICRTRSPALREIAPDQSAACHLCE